MDTNMLKETSNLTLGENSIYEDTKIGILKNIFKNEKEIEESFQGKTMNIEDFFKDLKEQVSHYYKS